MRHIDYKNIKLRKLSLAFLGVFLFWGTLTAQFASRQVSNWQIMRSTDKLSNQPFIRKYLPKQLDGRWTPVINENLLSNFADWIQLEYKKPGEDPYYQSWSIPWSTWFLKAPLFDSISLANGFYANYKLRLNRLECAELEIYINDQKLDIKNPTYGQTFIDQLIDVTKFLKKDGTDTIFVGFVGQMPQGLSYQRLDNAQFTADNEEPDDSMQKLFYGGIGGKSDCDGKVKISPYFRRPIMDFGWDFVKPNVQFGLGNGIELIGWSNLFPLSSEIKTDSIVYDKKGKPKAVYVTYFSEFDADFRGCKSENQFHWSPSFDVVIERNYSEKLVSQKQSGNQKKTNGFQVMQLPEDWVRMEDSTYELMEDAITGMNFDSVSKLKIVSKYVIYHPKLWYPNGYFQQVYPKDEFPTRYRFGMVFKRNIAYPHGYYPSTNLFMDAPFYTYTGFRTLFVDTSNGKFQFIVNNKKIMALGTNVVWNRNALNEWVDGQYPYYKWNYHGSTPYALSDDKPFEMKLSLGSPYYFVSPEHKPKPKNKQFQSMFKLGMNMVRFWGGGNYPPEEVFAECDKLGLLVWQDLMFSGTTYPAREDWNLEVGNEVDANISWMKTHPSLALICGNNEIEVALKNWGWFQKYNIHGQDSVRTWNGYKQLFDTFIPRKLQIIAPTIFYLPTSPIGNWGNLNQMKFGDNHDWGVWHGERNFNHVDSVIAPFVSEFGFPSLPTGYKESTDSISYQLLKFRSYKGLGLLNRYVKNETKNAQNYLVYPSLNQSVLSATGKSPSGRAQALFLDRAIRAYRTSSPNFGGCLFWQWNDIDRVVSWSVVDFDYQAKPAFLQMKQDFKPIVSFVRVPSDSTLKVSINSIFWNQQKLTVQVSIEDKNKMAVFKAIKSISVQNYAEIMFKVDSTVLKSGNRVSLKVLDTQGKIIDEL